MGTLAVPGFPHIKPYEVLPWPDSSAAKRKDLGVIHQGVHSLLSQES